MRIVFLASGAFAAPTLRHLVANGHDVALMITQPPRAQGRGRRITRTPAGVCAEELGIEVLPVDNVNDEDVLERVRETNATLSLAIAFGQKLGDDLLGCTPGGCINLHASILPKYRGAAPINWAIVRGEKRTGCTVFKMVQRMDAGPILASTETKIEPGETAGTLHDRLAELGVETVTKALAMFDDGAIPVGSPQDESAATTARKLCKADGLVRFDQSADAIANHICGMTPWPGAAARFESAAGRWEKITILQARRVTTDDPCKLEPGTISTKCFVAATDGYVELLEVKPSSGRSMSWRDYVNGRHVQAGDKMTTPDA